MAGETTPPENAKQKSKRKEVQCMGWSKYNEDDREIMDERQSRKHSRCLSVAAYGRRAGTEFYSAPSLPPPITSYDFYAKPKPSAKKPHWSPRM